MDKLHTLTVNGRGFALQDMGAVRFDQAQSLTDLEKARARENMGVVNGGDMGDVYFLGTVEVDSDVRVDLGGNVIHGVAQPQADTDAANKAYADTHVSFRQAQDLTDQEKALARENIGAAPQKVLTPIRYFFAPDGGLNTNDVFTYVQDAFFCRYTNKLKVDPGDRFSYVGNSAGSRFPSVIWYDETGNVCGSENYGTAPCMGCRLVTVPAGVAYARFCDTNAVNRNSLEELTEYEKLRFEVIHQPPAGGSRSLAIHSRVGGYYTQENNFVQVDFMSAKRSDPIPVERGDTFYFTGGGNDASKAIWFAADGSILSMVTGTGSQLAMTPPEGAVLVRFISYAYNTDPTAVILSVTWETDDRTLEYLQGMNCLWKKKYVACGDSFTAGDFAEKTGETWDQETQEYKTYCWHIANRNRMRLVNEAISGTTMHNNGAHNAFSVSRYTQIPADADYITLCFGLNETTATIGTLEDTTNETVMGAWNVVLEHLMENHPYAKIGIIIPDAWCSAAMREALIAVAQYWGIPYLDLTGDPQVPLMISGRRAGPTLSARAVELRTAAFAISESDTHPNAKGHAYRSTVIEHFLRSL